MKLLTKETLNHEFNLTETTLKIAKEDHSLVLSEPFYTLGGIGFALDYSNPPQSWIIFSVQSEKVKAIYKDAETYYRRELARPASGVIEVEFSEWDRITKHV